MQNSRCFIRQILEPAERLSPPLAELTPSLPSPVRALHPGPRMTFKRILVPVDFSGCSAAALKLAASLGAALHADVEVLFVSDGLGSDGLLGDELEKYVASVLPEASVPIRKTIEHGPPRARIVAVARRNTCDAIVMGTHGRTGRVRSLAGSIAEGVVRTAGCPVITVREPP
jgi:nucleotide-binding universal stress UspA family protein